MKFAPARRGRAIRGRSTHGGKLADIPHPHRRFYDDKRRRRVVDVSCMRYWGQGEHYYIRLTQDDNPIWNPSEFDGQGGWHQAWDDEKARGVVLAKKFSTMHEAVVWAEQACAKHFPDHRIEWSNFGSNVEKRWFYRDGD